MNLCLLAAFIAGLLFTANPLPSHADGKRVVVVATPLHFDAAETVWEANLPCLFRLMPMEFEKSFVMAHPDFRTLAGFKKRPPAKWECKG